MQGNDTLNVISSSFLSGSWMCFVNQVKYKTFIQVKCTGALIYVVTLYSLRDFAATLTHKIKIFKNPIWSLLRTFCEKAGTG